MTKQDILLNAIQDQEKLDLLYDVWMILQATPTKAATILVQFKDVTNAVKVSVSDMQDAVQRFEGLKIKLGEMEQVSDRISKWQKVVKEIDEKHVLNRMSRILEMAKQVTELKALGGLELLEKLMSK